jgi:uncharacterized protein (TIGR02246 family)
VNETDEAVTSVLDGWQDAIAQGDPGLVATHFTEDALFQGLRPEHTIGRAGVAEYYAAQRAGLRAAYETLRSQRLDDLTILTYQHVVFTVAEEVVADAHLTVVLRRSQGTWLIGHYHVSRV